jgi:hypothetical protein
MVPVCFDALRIGKATQGEEHDLPAAAARRIGNGKRQTAAAADDGKGFSADRICFFAHACVIHRGSAILLRALFLTMFARL